MLKIGPLPTYFGPSTPFLWMCGGGFQNQCLAERTCHWQIVYGCSWRTDCELWNGDELYVGRCRCIVFSRDAIIDLTAPDELQFNANNYYGSHHSTSIAVPTPPRAECRALVPLGSSLVITKATLSGFYKVEQAHLYNSKA